MDLDSRLKSFVNLGNTLRGLCDTQGIPGTDESGRALEKAGQANPWFTREHILFSLRAIAELLTAGKLDAWLGPYRKRLETAGRPKTVGVVMAGNIPLVGFHDFLCVLIAGHRIIIKPSSSDDVLLPFVARTLVATDPRWEPQIRFVKGLLEGFEAVIATGNNNTFRYFEYYFRNHPRLIRKNRNSVGVLTGDETPETLRGMADDIMLYFGMGCRSVSKLYVPKDYDFKELSKGLDSYKRFLTHHKYLNNYTWQRSVLMMNQARFLESGPVILLENEGIQSPVSVLHYEYYTSLQGLMPLLDEQKDSIQCIVSASPLSLPTIFPGQAQRPGPGDYADGTDTLEFLLS